MVLFDVVAGGDCVISNSGGVTHLRKGLKMLDLSVMQTFTRTILLNRSDFSFLSKEEWKALRDLRNDDTIIITRPDKGNGVAIVNRIDYLNKMKRLISDETDIPQSNKVKRD